MLQILKSYQNISTKLLNYLNYKNNFRNYLQNGHLVIIHTVQLHGTLDHSYMPAKFHQKKYIKIHQNTSETKTSHK